MKEITFIIPCAGKGSRLGIPFSKEIFPIEKEITLIDKIFNCLEQFKNKCQVVIIISKDKLDLVKYLSKYSDDFEIYFIYQKTYECELIGALKSAKELYSKKNIILMPDVIFDDKCLSEKINKYVNSLNSVKVSYLITKENNFERLSHLGNVKLSNHENYIEGIIEKPSIDLISKLKLKYYWFSFGFQYDNDFDFIMKIFEKMWSKKLEDLSTCFVAKYFKIDFALDLGIWDNVKYYYLLGEKK